MPSTARQDGRRRVVVTGLGAVTCLGTDLESFWDSLVAGKSGVGNIERFDSSQFDVHFAGEIKGFDPSRWIPAHEARKHDLFSLYAIAACDDAIKDAGLEPAKEDPDRVGVVLGTGIGGINEMESQHQRLTERGPGKVSPFLIPKMMCNAMAGQLSIRHGFRGPSFVTGSACASGAHAIGLALRSIQFGEADVILTGGSESAITPLGLAGFCALKALSTRNDAPQRASRPFDKDRDGFVMGEGAGMLVFEELEHAKRRGARIYAEVLGFGQTSDAYHITAPSPGGEGAANAMRRALDDAKLPLDAVDYVNAHGTSTPLNDQIETTAIKAVFGPSAKRLAISSTKSMIGHLLGASGSVELVVTALSVQRGVAHPTINQETRDPACDLDYVPNSARDLRIRAALSNSLGFGGHNVSLAIGRFEG